MAWYRTPQYAPVIRKPYSQRVQVPNDYVLGFRIIVVIVQVLGKYMIIWYSDPFGFAISQPTRTSTSCAPAAVDAAIHALTEARDTAIMPADPS